MSTNMMNSGTGTVARPTGAGRMTVRASDLRPGDRLVRVGGRFEVARVILLERGGAVVVELVGGERARPVMWHQLVTIDRPETAGQGGAA